MPCLQPGILSPLKKIYSLPCCLGREKGFLSQHLWGLLLTLEGMKQPRAVCKSPVSASAPGLRAEIDSLLVIWILVAPRGSQQS